MAHSGEIEAEKGDQLVFEYDSYRDHTYRVTGTVTAVEDGKIEFEAEMEGRPAFNAADSEANWRGHLIQRDDGTWAAWAVPANSRRDKRLKGNANNVEVA